MGQVCNMQGSASLKEPHRRFLTSLRTCCTVVTPNGGYDNARRAGKRRLSRVTLTRHSRAMAEHTHIPLVSKQVMAMGFSVRHENFLGSDVRSIIAPFSSRSWTLAPRDPKRELRPITRAPLAFCKMRRSGVPYIRRRTNVVISR